MSSDFTPQGRIDNVKKIAVLRANALGDFIVTLPALHALRSAYAEAEIVLLGRPWHQEFLVKGRSPVDRVEVVPVKKGIRNEANLVADESCITGFIEKMRIEHFDIVINMQGNGFSANPFIKEFGAKLTVGLCAEGAEKLDRNLDYFYYQSEVLRFVEVVKLVGATTVEIEPQIAVLPQDNLQVKRLIRSLGSKPYVAIHPIATDVRRMWPIQNYPLLADELKDRNVEVVFTGTPEDRQAVEHIMGCMSYSAINACGMFSLGGLSALLSKAALVISPDTGPLHLAQAVKAPTVGIYWAPNLINWGPLFRTRHRPLVSWKMECPCCYIVPNDPYPFEPRTDCNHEISFVRDITVKQVVDAADELLATSISDYSKATRKDNAGLGTLVTKRFKRIKE
jgi:ADP-heptose:LPS heptosyltransferase